VSADDEVHCAEPGVERTVYPVISEAPFESGADHETETEPLAAMTLEIRGADGAEVGMTAEVAFEVGPQLKLPGRRACTVNEYEVRAMRPVIVQLSVVVVHINPPGLDVRRYTRPSAVTEPSGITHPIVADPWPDALTETLRALPGRPSIPVVTEVPEVADAPDPHVLKGTTVNV
jgi:hypothetical protein